MTRKMAQNDKKDGRMTGKVKVFRDFQHFALSGKKAK